MKSLTEYLHEYIIEMNFQKSDFTKHSFKYRDGVINTLLNDEFILLGDKGENKFNISRNIKSQLAQELYTNMPMNSDSFNNIMDKFGLPHWNNIFKGTYSGKITDTDGQWAESLVCYIFNNGEFKIDEWLNYKKISNKWIDSCKLTVNFIKSQKDPFSGEMWDNKNYIMCHVDGKDYNLNSSYDFAKDITSIFAGKSNMKKIFNINCDDLYKGQKDAWNKADVVLVHKIKARTVIDDMKNVVVDGASINNYLIQLLKDGIVIPISLKELYKGKPIYISSYNVNNSDNRYNYIKKVDKVRFSTKYTNKYTGNIDIVCMDADNNEIFLTFRSDTNGKNGLNIEPSSKTGKYRFGKAVQVIKNLFKLNRSNEYYIFVNSIYEFMDIMESYGFKVDRNSWNNDFDNIDPPVKDRACVAGLLGILKQYKEKKYKNGDNFAESFCNFILACSMGLYSSGGFYKISN